MSLTEFTRFLVAFLVICAVAKSFDRGNLRRKTYCPWRSDGNQVKELFGRPTEISRPHAAQGIDLRPRLADDRILTCCGEALDGLVWAHILYVRLIDPDLCSAKIMYFLKRQELRRPA